MAACKIKLQLHRSCDSSDDLRKQTPDWRRQLIGLVDPPIPEGLEYTRAHVVPLLTIPCPPMNWRMLYHGGRPIRERVNGSRIASDEKLELKHTAPHSDHRCRSGWKSADTLGTLAGPRSVTARRRTTDRCADGFVMKFIHRGWRANALDEKRLFGPAQRLTAIPSVDDNMQCNNVPEE